MKKIVYLIIIGIFIGCGSGYVKDDTYNRTYDMWRYMTPDRSMDIEYNMYENGVKIDYFYETNKLFPSGVVERVSGEDRTVLTPYEDEIIVEEPNGEIISVQRYVKIKDINIFKAPSIQSCSADDYFRTIRIRQREFNEVIKINCKDRNSSNIDIYYGRDEGIVSIYRERDGNISEVVKVKDVPLM